MLALALLLDASAMPTSIAERIVAAAQPFASGDPTRIRHCNQLVVDVLTRAGQPVSGDVRGLHAHFAQQGWLHDRTVPSPGDIAFFDYTWDKNRNGVRDDRLTHVAIVTAVDEHGTIALVHRGSSTRSLVMNLVTPGRTTDGRTTNSYLARAGYAAPGQRLASELFATFATLPDDAVEDTRVAALVDDAPLTRRERRRARKRARAMRVDALPRVAADSPLDRVRRGEPLPDDWAVGARCEDLWVLRNGIYARHGYTFTTPRAQATFGAFDWYTPDARVHSTTVQLTANDLANRTLIQQREAATGCAR